MDEKKGIERRKFIKKMGKGLAVAAYVVPTIMSFTLTESAEARGSCKSSLKGSRREPHDCGKISRIGGSRGPRKHRDKKHKRKR